MQEKHWRFEVDDKTLRVTLVIIALDTRMDMPAEVFERFFGSAMAALQTLRACDAKRTPTTS
jgi:hypothetical protein